MRVYEKIETIFKRDIFGTKRLILGSYQNPTVEFLKDCQWDFTEKIDGMNLQVAWDGYEVTFNGRDEGSAIPAKILPFLFDTFKSTAAEELFEQNFGTKKVILYGEGFGGRIQTGAKDYQPNESFILFDVVVEGNYQPRDNVEAIARMFGIQVVPLVFSGKLEEGVDYVRKHPKSLIGLVIWKVWWLVPVWNCRIVLVTA